MALTLIFGAIGIILGYFIFLKFDAFKSKLNEWAKVDFMPETNIASKVVVASAICLAILLSFMKLSENAQYIISGIFGAVLILTVIYFTFRDENRKRGFLLGLYYVVSSILLFTATIMVLIIVLALALLYLILMLSGYNKGGKGKIKIKYEDGTEEVVNRDRGLMGEESFRDKNGNEYDISKEILSGEVYHKK